jgi:hypothetical protein
MRLVLLFLVALGTSAAGAATTESSPMADMKVTIGIDHEAIRDAVWLESDEVQACYSQSLKSIPGLKGKMVVSFDVDETGKAKNFKRVSGNILNQDIYSCVSKALEAAEFPPAAVGTVTTVQYPFVFSEN